MLKIKQILEWVFYGGRRGIRTPDRENPYNRFRVCRIRPLCHPSVSALNLIMLLHVTDLSASRSLPSVGSESAAFDHSAILPKERQNFSIYSVKNQGNYPFRWATNFAKARARWEILFLTSEGKPPKVLS